MQNEIRVSTAVCDPYAYVFYNGKQAYVESYGSKVKWNQIEELTEDQILAAVAAEYKKLKEVSAIKNKPAVKQYARKSAEKNYDNIWNEGGEGYNPHRYGSAHAY